jgi:hypothetical protein
MVLEFTKLGHHFTIGLVNIPSPNWFSFGNMFFSKPNPEICRFWVPGGGQSTFGGATQLLGPGTQGPRGSTTKQDTVRAGGFGAVNYQKNSKIIQEIIGFREIQH